MGGINRYDDISVSAYNPMTTQEIMMVPLMRRTQHDEANKQLQAQISELGKVDPLDVHFEQAQKIKADLRSQIDKQAEQLATEGFNNNTTGSVFKTNREIQDQFSPTGNLGQINAAKIQFNKEKEEFIKNAETQKIGRDQALKLWNEKTKSYTGYEDPEKSKIINVTPQGVAAYQNYGEDISRAHSILGKTVEGISSSGHHLEQDATGGFWEVTRNNERMKSNNAKQIEAAYNSFIDKWISNEGEGTRYSKDAALGIDENRIKNDFNSMLENSNILKSSESANYNTPPKAETVDPGGMIISNDSTLTSDAISNPTYSDALESIKKLSSSPTLSAADRSKLEDLIELRKNADSKLNQNKDYKLLDSRFKSEYSKWEKLASKMNLSQQEKESLKNNPNFLPNLLFSKGVGAFKGSKSDPDLKLIMDNKSLSTINNILNKRQVFKDKAWKDSSSLRHNYSYLPSTPKEESEWNLHNENIYNTLKGLPDMGSVLDLTSIYTPVGNKKNVTSEDVLNIQTLLKNGDPKSFKINNIKTYGDNKTPEVTMTFNTLEGATEYDMNGTTSAFSSGEDNYGGSQKPVTVTFRLKKFSNSFDTGSAAGYKNLTGAIGNFWKNKGGINQITGNFQGAEIYNSMIENAYSEVSDKELYARAQSDSDAREALLIRVAKHKAKK